MSRKYIEAKMSTPPSRPPTPNTPGHPTANPALSFPAPTEQQYNQYLQWQMFMNYQRYQVPQFPGPPPGFMGLPYPSPQSVTPASQPATPVAPQFAPPMGIPLGSSQTVTPPGQVSSPDGSASVTPVTPSTPTTPSSSVTETPTSSIVSGIAPLETSSKKKSARQKIPIDEHPSNEEEGLSDELPQPKKKGKKSQRKSSESDSLFEKLQKGQKAQKGKKRKSDEPKGKKAVPEEQTEESTEDDQVEITYEKPATKKKKQSDGDESITLKSGKASSFDKNR